MKVFKILGWVLLLIFVLFVIAWFTGAVGSGVAHLARRYLPYQAGKEFRVDKFYYADAVPDHNGRVFFALSLNRLEQMIDKATPYDFLIPPGLLKDGLVIEAAWIPWKRDKETRVKSPMGVEIPVGIVIRDTNGDHPRITGRLPVAMLTTYIGKEFERDFREEREEWELGHYAYEIKPQVMFCTLRTTNDVAMPPDRYAEKLYLKLIARADVEMKFEENIGTIEARGDLSLQVNAAFQFAVREDGLSPWYDADVSKVDANIKGVNVLIDDEISDKLKKKWHKSLNREKRKKRLAKKRIPLWFPTDLVINVTFEPE